MSVPSTVQGDTYFNGNLSAQSFTPPSGCITDAAVSGSGATAVAASKLICHERIGLNLFAAATTVTAIADQYVFTAKAAGTLLSFQGVITGTVATGADRTIAIQLSKSTGGGAYASVLTTPINFTNGSVLLTPVAATINTAGYIAGDSFRLSLVVAGAAGAQALGLGVTLAFAEQYI